MLFVHRAERADRLAGALAELLCAPLADPFAGELVAVPTHGMERWLAQRLSARLGTSAPRRDGICANVLFPQPARLIADALAAASGIEPDDDPWLPEHSTWPLLDVVQESLAEPWLRSLAVYLGRDGDPPDPARGARRLSAVRHLADLFHRYERNRPEMVLAWAAGTDGNGNGAPLPAEARWQAELWRRLRERIALPAPAERLEPACARLREEPDLLELPGRLSLFGLTRLSALDVRVLEALAACRDVHVFVLHPSPALWDRIARLPRSSRAVRRAEDPTARLPVNPLLASWGRDARELQLLLPADGEHLDYAREPSRATLLERLQADVIGDSAPPGAPLDGEPDHRPALDPADRSVQVHSCHGRARQVEVARDAILHLLADDPTLEPRDVIVMSPDVEAFAPLIEATFGTSEAAQDGDLRVRLADRSLRQTNPILAALSELLELPGQRLTASQVLGFADREPVRRRFGLRDGDLTRIQRWISDAGIRWGLDAEHRAPFKLASLPSGTWETGLDRLLLGVAMAAEGSRLFEGVLPLDDVESGAIDLAGRLTELIARLRAAIDALSEPKPIAAWTGALAAAVDSLTATRPGEAWQRGELQRILDELLRESGRGSPGSAEPTAGAAGHALALPEIRALLADRLAGRPTRAGFRTGHLTVCTLHPMRSVPHRVVCLLGLDDGLFPRKAPRDGDDLLLADPRAGERDPRSEDRQLLLDALLAAREHIVITYTGNDERTNLPRPPAVPVGELLDAISATVRGEQGDARAQVLLRHPLQPFDRRNFQAGAIAGGRPWSFDPLMLAGARALEGPRAAPGRFLQRPLEPLRSEVIALSDLVAFVQHPVRAFLRTRLRLYLGEIDDEVQDALAVELDGLERWGIGDRLLEAILAGIDERSAYLAEIARGTLPPGALGEPVVRELFPIARAIRAQAESLASDRRRAESLDVHVRLADGRLLSGTVAGARGGVILTPTFSRVSPKHRLRAWVELLAATASSPELALGAATVGRAGSDQVTTVRIGQLGDTAEERLQRASVELQSLVELYDEGMREPLPLYCKTSTAYAAAPARDEDPVEAAGKQWRSDFNFDGEDREPEHMRALGGERSLEEVLADGRFAALAHRLWDPLLSREEVATG